MAVDARFTKGLELFNKKEYFECHEVIEALWLETPESDPYRDLYKGVIQAAAAIYQFDRGILSGARGLYCAAIGHLSSYAPVALGLNVAKLIHEMEICFRHLTQSDGKTKLILEEKLIPKLEFEQLA